MSAADALAQHIEHVRELARAKRRLELAKTALSAAFQRCEAIQAMRDEVERAEAEMETAVLHVLLTGGTLEAAVKPPVGRTLSLVHNEDPQT